MSHFSLQKIIIPTFWELPGESQHWSKATVHPVQNVGVRDASTRASAAHVRQCARTGSLRRTSATDSTKPSVCKHASTTQKFPEPLKFFLKARTVRLVLRREKFGSIAVLDCFLFFPAGQRSPFKVVTFPRAYTIIASALMHGHDDSHRMRKIFGQVCHMFRALERH